MTLFSPVAEEEVAKAIVSHTFGAMLLSGKRAAEAAKLIAEALVV